MTETNRQPMQVPNKIGHSYTFKEFLDFEKLNTAFKNHKRLRVFHAHGTRCANPGCGKEGIHLIKAANNQNGFHIDVYTKDFEMMTIDHILPRSLGGSNAIENLQPMCNTCNHKKGNKVDANVAPINQRLS